MRWHIEKCVHVKYAEVQYVAMHLGTLSTKLTKTSIPIAVCYATQLQHSVHVKHAVIVEVTSCHNLAHYIDHPSQCLVHVFN